MVVARGVDGSSAATHALNNSVTVLADASRVQQPACSSVCSTRYRLSSPRQCDPLEWACGYTAEGGPARGYFPTGVCADPVASCACSTAGAPSCVKCTLGVCVAGGLGTCACAKFPSSEGDAERALSGVARSPLPQPWSKVVFRLEAGLDTDGCAGPYSRCVGSNPYQVPGSHPVPPGPPPRSLLLPFSLPLFLLLPPPLLHSCTRGGQLVVYPPTPTSPPGDRAPLLSRTSGRGGPGYRLVVNGVARRIIGWSGASHVVQVDSPFAPDVLANGQPGAGAPVPGLTGYTMLSAPECTAQYDNEAEKRACAQAQYYQLMVCDQPPAHGLAGGLIMSGFAPRNAAAGAPPSPGCVKSCGDPTLCDDSFTDWYRADTGAADVGGTVFKRNGRHSLPAAQSVLLSVGVRYVEP